MFSYKTDNLYIGGLGIVEENNCNYKISKIDYAIAFKMKKEGFFDEKIGSSLPGINAFECQMI